VGTFINVLIDESRLPAEQASRLPALCPVDIFVLDNGHLRARAEQEDECTLCELCLTAAAPGAITIRKTYKDEALVSRGGATEP
jgi:NAD-dependent dihydropyrimidine dehydrogenase PreA subunit